MKDFFSGEISNFIIYNDILKDNEIISVFNSLK